MRTPKMIALAACLAIAGPFSASADEMEDSRQLIKLPKDIEQKMLVNMRDHITSLDEIIGAIVAGEYEKAEDRAFAEQISALPKGMKRELAGMRGDYRKQKTKESVIARDADILECLIQAKEYHAHGFKEAVKFMKKAPGFLKTKSAKALWRLAKKTDINKWWEDLSEFKR